MIRRSLIQTKGVAVNLTLLGAILLHNLTYPLSVADGLWPAVFYCFYAVIYVAATWALTGSEGLRCLAVVSGLSVLIAGLMNAYLPTSWAALAVFVTSVIYHLIMIVVLAGYTFRARTVLADVVLSATSLYLVIGSGFAAVFAIIEWLAPGSFIASSGAPLHWQHMMYYSYVTLTTLGYGDITPIGFYAQAVASFEAVTGVLYTVILLSRLVGMYGSAHKQE